VITLLP